jgi:hypothetical protein
MAAVPITKRSTVKPTSGTNGEILVGGANGGAIVGDTVADLLFLKKQQEILLYYLFE